jgi:dihydrofolate reductase
MSKLRCHIAISLDGFVAGPNQSEQNPLGERGELLHGWMAPLATWRESHGQQGGEVDQSTQIMEETRENVGAGVMGRNMFGPIGGGDWGDGQWKGWWGDDPPYHNDVFILTHHPRDAAEMEGGTTYHFVTDGIERALELAREAANGQDVRLWGGAQAIQQYMAAGLLDVLELHVVPLLLRDGERLFDNLEDAVLQLEQVRAVEAPGVTHVKYSVRPTAA